MYLLNELLLSIPLVLYAAFRIRRLFSRPLFKTLFTAVFALVVLGFPVSEFLSHRSSAAWTRTLMRVGYYMLPLLLYVVLIVIFSDLFLGLLRLLKLLSRDTVRKPGFRKTRLAFYIIAPVVIVIAGIWNYGHLRYHEYAVEIPRKSSEITRLKIAFVSDFHLGEQTEDGFMARFVEKVNALDADIILIGGDVLEGDRRDEALARFEAEFRRLKARYGVFGVFGNHDRFGGGRTEFFEKSGIRILQDEVVKIAGAFYLAGRKDAGRGGGNRKSIADLLRETPDDLPLIVLDHRPTDLEAVSRTRADIQLSGHTHHGQLFPINYIADRQYELSWGHLKKGETHVFVTSGIQLWGPRVRTIGWSEIMVIDVALRDVK
jgi:predicted MPP superfamily phosphohydrolase